MEAVLQKNIRYPVEGHRGGCPPEEHQVSSKGTSWRLYSRRISGIQWRDIVEAVLQENIRLKRILLKGYFHLKVGSTMDISEMRQIRP